MEAAQRDEIRKPRLPALRPVLYVMAVHEPCMRTTREPTALIAGAKCAAQCGRNCAGLAADIQRLTLFVLNEYDEARITCEATRGLSRNARAFFQLAATGMTVPQGLGIHMHHDLLAITTRNACWSLARKPSAINASASARLAARDWIGSEAVSAETSGGGKAVSAAWSALRNTAPDSVGSRALITSEPSSSWNQESERGGCCCASLERPSD